MDSQGWALRMCSEGREFKQASGSETIFLPGL